MKQNVIFLKQCITNILILMICIFSVLLSANRLTKENEHSYVNQARVLINSQIKNLENEIYPDGPYPYIILNSAGILLHSYMNSDYVKGASYNTNELLQVDNFYLKSKAETIKVPIILNQNTSQLRFAVFFIPKNQLTNYTGMSYYIYIFTPIFIGIFILFLFLMARTILLKRNILNPIKEISESAHAIIEGNLNLPVVSTKSKRLLQNEVDKLSFGFELMRDELQAKQLKEEQLKRSQKELISCISHDLKTPITTIKAYSEGLRDGLPKDPKKRQHYYEVMVKKCTILSKMIHDLLEHSNAELNELSIQKKECYFNQYFNRLMKELALNAEHQGFIFSYVNESPDVLVMLDESRMNQVFYNLFENAYKYMENEQKKIVLHASYDSYHHQIEISVKDNGRGISISDIPYVFDKFYRAEKSRNMSIPGSGLGLSICKYIVEKHGGTISCHSTLNEGTKFIFTIPCDEK